MAEIYCCDDSKEEYPDGLQVPVDVSSTNQASCQIKWGVARVYVSSHDPKPMLAIVPRPVATDKLPENDL